MIARPGALPVTNPDEETEAIEESLLIHTPPVEEIVSLEVSPIEQITLIPEMVAPQVLPKI